MCCRLVEFRVFRIRPSFVSTGLPGVRNNSFPLLQLKPFHVEKYREWRLTAVGDLLPGEEKEELEYGPMPNVMAALPNIGGALCSTRQSLADAYC